MADRDEQGFEIVPTRLIEPARTGRSARLRRAPLILVAVLAVAIPTLAWIGPRIEWRPEVDLSFLRPTPTPTSTPQPTRSLTAPTPTPLPAITAWAGPHPTAPFPVDVGGLRLADPATGSLGLPLGVRGDNDAIFSSRDGGWWCVCFGHLPETDRETVTVEIRRFDRSGLVARHPVGDYRSVAPPPSQDFYTRFDLAISPDQRTAYLSSATRTGNQWKLAVEAIDLATAKVTARKELATVVIPPITGPTPPPDQGLNENYLSGPLMRMSPDGTRLLVWASMEINSQTGPQPPASEYAWLIALDQKPGGGSIGGLTSLAKPFADRLRTCYWAVWTTADELAAFCWPIDQQSGSNLTVAVFRPDGTEQRHADLLGAMNSWLADPVLDRANRVAFLWQPGDHLLRRIALDTLRADELRVDPTATVTKTGSGSPGSGLRPDWVRFTSDLRLSYGPQLIAEPGGSRLFALGVLPDSGTSRRTQGSSGIWVFDAGRLLLLDRWRPAAAYSNIGVSSDGRWLLAAGTPGGDADGNQANWEASITVHDITDGRPALQFGSLGTDAQVLQVPP